MDTGKIKNFVILVLAVANLFLLFVSASNAAREAEVRSAAKQELVELYARSGVSLSAPLDVYDAAPRAVELTRNMEAEMRIAEAVIGECTVVQQGGNIYVYNGARGDASFRGTGEFEMLLDYGVADMSGGAVDTASGILEDMGMERGSYTYEDEGDGEYIVTFNCRYNGVDVYNARISFLFYGESLMMISGKRVFDAPAASDQSDALSLGPALVRFLDEAESNGYIFTEVTGASAGYAMEVTVSGDCALSPVWYINTDAGDYTLSAVTGRLVTIAY